LRGGGDELAQVFPLRMMADAFGVSRHPADPTKAEIARLLRGETGGSGAVDPVLAAGERLLELVDRHCAGGPLVLVSEDLHWADEPSLLVWNRLARGVDQIPLLLVGTCHPVPYRATVARLRELVLKRRGELVELGPLGEDDVHRIAARILGAEPGPLLRGELARAGGNPLYVEELVGALVRDGLIEVAGGVAEFHGDSGAVPESLAVAIGRRLRFPTADTADVLRIAALFGNDFDLDELAIWAWPIASGAVQCGRGGHHGGCRICDRVPADLPARADQAGAGGAGVDGDPGGTARPSRPGAREWRT
jgi:hypothetical protein